MSNKKPNILMIMVDQLRFPPQFGDNQGFHPDIKKILRFEESSDDNSFKKHYPGFWALRRNAVVFRNHRIASSACVPSRTVLFTGQYGTQTGSTQTDGLFKEGADKNFPWLEQDSVPTIGDWMQANNYNTHYFGKWHISGEDTTDLEGYGFKDWELSYPDPHGTLPNNLGYYRDHQFVGLVTSFLHNQGLGVPFDVENAKYNADPENLSKPDPEADPKPWFAVASFTNPHDIASYPGLPSKVCDARVDGVQYTLAVPPEGTLSEPPKTGSMRIKLNTTGFPQDCAEVSPTWNEDLSRNNKPDCQSDYAYKMGLALTCKMGRLAVEKLEDKIKKTLSPAKELEFATKVTLDTNATGLPFALTDNPELASRSFMQYYGYVIKEVDQHIKATLDALDESGLADNTIVIFCPDHGEYGASHGMMMEKWHTGYEEVIHVPMVVRLPDNLVTKEADTLRQVDELTSHIDILPTILGLAGVSDKKREKIKDKLANGKRKHNQVMEPIGCDLSETVYGQPNSALEERKGVLFMTYDSITEGLKSDQDTEEAETGLTNYQVFCSAIRQLNKASDLDLYPRSVVQPNNVHCVVDKDNWKLVRYFDPSESNPKPDQYELYDLNEDPTERNNLVVYNESTPTVKPGLHASDNETVTGKVEELKSLMEELERDMLYPDDGIKKPS